jgi:hypothetical protein
VSPYGIKISKRKYDVKRCDDRHLIMSSALSGLKVAYEGSFSMTLPKNTYSKIFTIKTHNLGYEPMFLMEGDGINTEDVPCVVDTSKTFFYPYPGFGVNIDCWTTTTDLKALLICRTLGEVDPINNRTWTGYYKIFHNPFKES